MGGTKRMIPIEKIANKDPRAVAFSKRRHGLYSKTTELCLLSGAQIAILATPVSSNSHVSFYSYGHSSVDSVVSAFLKNECPKAELGLGRWWEDERLVISEDANELKSAMDSVSSMLNDLKALSLKAATEKQTDHDDEEKLVLQGTHQEKILNLESSSNSEMNTTSQNPWYDCEAVEDEGAALVFHKDLDEVNKHFSDFGEDQIVAMCDLDALYGNFDGCNEDLDLDVMVDYEKNSESFLFT